MPVAEIVPELVRVVDVPVLATALLAGLSIVTPELIVTSELLPLISKSVQFAVIVTVVPETSVQSTDYA